MNTEVRLYQAMMAATNPRRFSTGFSGGRERGFVFLVAGRLFAHFGPKSATMVYLHENAGIRAVKEYFYANSGLEYPRPYDRAGERISLEEYEAAKEEYTAHKKQWRLAVDEYLESNLEVVPAEEYFNFIEAAWNTR